MSTAQASEIQWCAYCGRLADTVDHVVPRHLLKRAVEIGYHASPARKLLVPACRECNSYLGGRIHGSMAERRKCAKEGIRKRYAKALRCPDWSPCELAEMSPSLQREIRITLLAKAETRERLAWTNPHEVDCDIAGAMDLFRTVYDASRLGGKS